MKRFRTKEPGAHLKVANHGDVHDGNLTTELYNILIKENPNLAAQFREVDEEPKAKPKAAEKETKTKLPLADGKEIKE